MKRLTILGATGSIGSSTLAICRLHPQRYQILALTANTDVKTMLAHCREFKPRFAVMADQAAALQLQQRLQQDDDASVTQVLGGSRALQQVAALEDNDMVMAAIVGAAGLLPSLAAVKAGKRVLLANKEALVMSGSLFMQAARSSGSEILPVDSEHNAIFQCLPDNFSAGLKAVGVSRLLLTASGGPFLNLPLEKLHRVKPEQAVAHPNWSMGRKISVDSASMMNKGLEIIEAHWLFSAPADTIDVVIHPQSVIHSLVQYVDGSVLAQLGNPDMRTPIAHAMAWPERIDSKVKPLDLFEIARLDFSAPDLIRFPNLRLAFEALNEPDSAPAILNAANEVSVEAFLNGQIPFTDIARINEQVMQILPAVQAESVDQLLEIDSQARKLAHQQIKRR